MADPRLSILRRYRHDNSVPDDALLNVIDFVDREVLVERVRVVNDVTSEMGDLATAMPGHRILVVKEAANAD